MSLMPMSPSHLSTWADFLLWRRVFWTVIVFGPMLAIAASMVITGSDRVLLPLALWGLAVILVSLRLQRFRCPRCQHHFFPQRPPLLGLMAHRCVSCMLPKE